MSIKKKIKHIVVSSLLGVFFFSVVKRMHEYVKEIGQNGDS